MKVKEITNSTELLINYIEGIDFGKIKKDDIYVKKGGRYVLAAEVYDFKEINGLMKSFGYTAGDKSFIKVNQEFIFDAAKNLKKSEYMIMTFLISQMNYNGMIYGLKTKLISEKLGISERFVREGIEKLKNLNIIAETESSNMHFRIYVINPIIARKGGYIYSKFIGRYFSK